MSKTHRPENGHFDVLMTFVFLLPTYTKQSFHLCGKMCSSLKINRSVWKRLSLLWVVANSVHGFLVLQLLNQWRKA